MSRTYDPERGRALLRLGVHEPADAHLRTVEEAHLLRVLAVCDGNRTLAAQVLAIARRTLQRKLRGVDPELLKSIEAVPAPERPPTNTKSKALRRRLGPVPRIDGALVLTLRARGRRWTEIAAKLGCSSHGAILAAKRAKRDAVERSERTWTRIDVERVRALRAAGRTWRAVAGELHCSVQGARLAVQRTGTVEPAVPEDAFSMGLAGRLGCSPDRAQQLLAMWPPSERSRARRLEILQLRFGDRLSRVEIARRLEASPTYVRTVERAALDRLADLQGGRGRVSTRLKNGISNIVGTKEWSLESVAPKLQCRFLLSMKNIGRKSLVELHGHVRDVGLKMGCGCPDLLCASATRALRANTVPEISAETSKST